MRVLAGDIGGTSARVAIFDIDHDEARMLRQRRYASEDFPGLAPIVRTFLADVTDPPDRACFGVACPVVDGTCAGTNLSWTIDIASLPEEIGIPRAAVINDLHAVGRGLQRLGPGDLATLQAGEPRKRGPIAVMAAGTGLGEAYLTWSGDEYLVHDSEGGHGSFSPGNELEWGLARWVESGFGHASCERVLSGPGLVNIYGYLVASGGASRQPGVQARPEGGDAAVIGRNALAGTDPLSVEALDLFVSMLGAEAGNLALTVMATGGVYLAGGIAPRIVAKLRDGTFIRAFRAKGRLSDLLERVPVHAILNPHVGLIGAADAALHLEERGD